jgi:uncharacterized membrane protein
MYNLRLLLALSFLIVFFGCVENEIERYDVLISVEPHGSASISPEDLAKYNTIESSFAERILRMAEKDQENSDRIQNRRSTFGFLVTSAGLLFAAGTIAGLIYALIVSIQLGMEAVAASIVVSMAGVAGVFVFRNK